MGRPSDVTSLAEVLAWRASAQPDRTAYVFLADGERAEERVTYGALDRKARTIAAALQEIAEPGARALLLYPSGLDYVAGFFGCLYAGVIAVPAWPPDPARLARTLPRVQGIAADCRAAVALGSSLLRASGGAALERAPELSALRWILTDALDEQLAARWRRPPPAPAGISFLQYTSGSTSAPKGVIISHRNLLHTLEDMAFGWDQGEDSVSVSWLPVFHDLGLIYGLLDPVYLGHLGVFMSPMAFLQRPIRWLQAISRYRGTHSAAPNFAFDLCVRKTTPAERAGLDLRSWRVVLNAAEPIRAETLERFVQTFAPAGLDPSVIRPGFGLAEATLKVSTVPLGAEVSALELDPAALERGRVVPAPGRPDARRVIGCGWTALGTRAVIVDPETLTPCPDDHVGEIWVAGPAVAQGYWDRPEESARAFQASLAGSGEGPFLRTGDLGFVHAGQLHVTGRLKDLIILDGRNHYPQDIELTVERCNPALRPGCGAAFTIEAEGGERLVIVQEVEAKRAAGEALDLAALAEAVAEAVVAEHDLPVHAVAFLKPGSIHKTSSGKIQRRACRAALLDGTLEQVHLWSRRRPAAEAARPAVAAPGLLAWLTRAVADAVGLRAEEIDPRAPFARWGLTSAQAVTLSGELARHLDRPVSPTLFWEHPSPTQLAAHLAGAPEPAAAPAVGAARAGEPIAIVGIGCRFPGADDPRAFWRLLHDGVDAVSEVPADRWDAGALHDPDPAAPGKITTRRGGFLRRVDGFDPLFFGISPREAPWIDPQQRLLLEVAWEALEDAGVIPGRLAGAPVGVFVGIANSDYGRMLLSGSGLDEAFTGTGSSLSIAANRLSYQLDLRGPSLAIDTACSSSLVAIQLACEGLRAGRCSLALAGGVNLILSPELSVVFSRAGFLSPDGRCKAFDAGADGYVRGEGAGVVVLKRLADARRDGDRIYAVIRGGAVNQDGRTNGLTAPNRRAQEAVVREAWRDAGLSPADASLIEAHGTGTSLGDPIEAAALGAVLAEGRAADRPCALGSVKTNIGHLETAAGVAGLIKVALSLHHRTLAPSLHFRAPNPLIPFDGLPLRVQQTREPWPDGPHPRRAGVSSFGFGGTNAHVVLEEAPAPAEVEAAASEEPLLIPLSARSPGALRALAGRLIGADARPADLGHTLARRRTHHEHRAALVAGSPAELAARLAAAHEGRAERGLWTGEAPREPTRVALVFCGQGPQRPAMGLELAAREPVFRDALDRCDATVRAAAGWSLWEELRRPESASRLSRTEIAQPGLVALQCALAELWRSWGVVADAVVGHSVGEIAAAQVAGALSLEDAMLLAIHRGRRMQAIEGAGRLVVVRAGADRAAALAERLGGRAAVAAVNGPLATVLAIDAAGLEPLARELAAQDIPHRTLPGEYAFHSPQVEPLLAGFARDIAGVPAGAPGLPLFSTLTGERVSGPLGPAHWVQQARRPVLFAAALERLLAAERWALVEVGPHPVLAEELREAVARGGGAALGSLRRGEGELAAMRSAAAALFCGGHALDWDKLAPAGRCVSLPTVPWQRERFWVDAPRKVEAAGAAGPRAGEHPLLGAHRSSAAHPGTHALAVTVPRDGWWSEHTLGGVALLPAAATAELSLAAAAAVTGAAAWRVESLELRSPIRVGAGAPASAQVELSEDAQGGFTLHVSSQRGRALEVHAAGVLRPDGGAPAERVDLAALGRACPEPMSAAAFQAFLAGRGAAMGPSFQCVEALAWGEAQALGRARLIAPRAAEVTRFRIHPALLDACFQIGGALAARASGSDGGFVPIGFAALRLAAPPGAAMWVHATGRPAEPGAELREVDLRLIGDDGAVLGEIAGARFLRARLAAEAAEPEVLVMQWGAHPVPAAPPDRGRWLVLADAAGLGERLVEARERAGGRCVVAVRGEGFRSAGARRYEVDPASPAAIRALLAAAREELGEDLAVVHLWGLDAAPAAELDPSRLSQAQRLGCVAALHVVQAVAKWERPPRLWLLTRGAWPVLAGERAAGLAGAPLWGLSRTIGEEHPELRCACVDLDPSPEQDALAGLVALLGDEAHAPALALRGGSRWVGRLIREAAAGEAAPVGFRADGVYWITGGLGALGLRVAQWLVEQGARHLALTGRGAPGPAAAAAIAALRGAGAAVELLPADVADPAAVAGVVAAIERLGPPLRGVIHAAGVLDDGLLELQDRGRFERVLAPKVLGAWNLHRATATAPLEVFALFSSAAATLGSAGQGGYAAANAFLDALALHRRASGRPALSVAWGPWGEVGMAAERPEVLARLAARGLRPLAPRQALAALGGLLARGVAQATVVSLDGAQRAALDGERAGRPARRAPSVRAALATAPPRERAARLAAHLTEVMAAILRVPATRIEPRRSLQDLGLESALAVELKARLEETLGLALPATLVWSHPTIDALTRHLSAQLGWAEDAGERPAADDPIEASIGALSEDEAEAELLARIAELEGSKT